jgi:hypothetical protein
MPGGTGERRGKTQVKNPDDPDYRIANIARRGEHDKQQSCTGVVERDRPERALPRWR